MGILETLLAEFKTSDLDEQVKRLCDLITDEERGKIKASYTGPDGPNVFLSLEALRTDKEQVFLCLEREESEKYIVTLYSRYAATVGSGGKLPPVKRTQMWLVNEDKANKILLVYAQKMKYVRGE